MSTADNNNGLKTNLNSPMAFENLKGFLHVQVLCLLQNSRLIQMLKDNIETNISMRQA